MNKIMSHYATNNSSSYTVPRSAPPIEPPAAAAVTVTLLPPSSFMDLPAYAPALTAAEKGAVTVPKTMQKVKMQL